MKALALIPAIAGLTSAETFSFGMKIGIPMNSLLTSAAPGFTVTTHRYTLGPTIEMDLPLRFAVEADLIYKRLEYGFAPSGASATQTPPNAVKASRWELPVLLKYKLAGRHFHPFLEAGASFTRVVHIEGMNVAELRHRGTKGILVGTGVEKRLGRLRLTPEARITRWADRNFGVHDAPLRSNLTQAEFLIGVTF